MLDKVCIRILDWLMVKPTELLVKTISKYFYPLMLLLFVFFIILNSFNVVLIIKSIKLLY